LSITTIIILCIVGFAAAFLDSIAGGGGILTVPALMAAGLPPHLTLGTNKFSATNASFTSTLTFLKSKKIHLPLIKYILPFSFFGAALGVNTVLKINEKYLQIIILVLLVFVALNTLFNKDVGTENNFQGLTRKTIILGCIVGFSVGFYDGFFGPGTVSILLYAFIRIFKFDFTIGTANARILNFTSNVTSLILFAYYGRIVYAVGIPMALSMIFGAYLGTKTAIKHGGKIIKPIFVTMSLGIVVKLLIDTF
jgi:uncharacterized membrane protein YfcA